MGGHFFVPRYSEQLRARTTAYFEQRFKTSVSNEEADLYLENLAALFSAFETTEADKRASASLEAAQACPLLPPLTLDS